MSRIRHDTEAAEELARVWHVLGAWLSAASTVVTAAGLVWHIWAIRQHDEAIEELRKQQ